MYGPTGSNIIFVGNKNKPLNPLKVLCNVATSKVECHTDSCFRYKSSKFCKLTVAVAVHLKIFEKYISKVNRYSAKDFLDNVVNISRNPNTDQKKTNSLKKGEGKRTTSSKKL